MGTMNVVRHYRKPISLTGGAAPFALDGTPQAANSGSSNALALSAFSTTYPNSLICVAVMTNGGPATAPTGGGLSFTLRKRQGTNPTNLELWTAIADAPLSSQVITVNTTSADFVTACVFAFSGVNAASPFDSNGALPGTTNSFTTSNADDILLCIGRLASSSETEDAGFTLITGADFLGVEYKIVSATQSGTTVTPFSSGVTGMIVDAIVKG